MVIRLLRDQRSRDFEMDFRGEAHRQPLAVRRKLLCKAFGVKAAKDWLPSATSVSVVDTGGTITVTPWRRDGKQDAWHDPARGSELMRSFRSSKPGTTTSEACVSLNSGIVSH